MGPGKASVTRALTASLHAWPSTAHYEPQAMSAGWRVGGMWLCTRFAMHSLGGASLVQDKTQVFGKS